MKSFVDLLLKYESFLIFEQRLSKLTVASYSTDINLFFLFIKKEYSSRFSLSLFNQASFSNFLLNQAKSCQKASTLARRISSLSSFSKFLAEKTSVPYVSFDKHFLEFNKSLPVFLSLHEFSRVSSFLFDDIFFLNFSNISFEEIRNRLILIFLYSFGLRASELISLTTSDLSFEADKTKGSLKILGKGDRVRILPIPSSLSSVIIFYLNIIRPAELKINYPFLFFALTPSPKQLSRQFIWSLVKKFSLDLNLSSSFSPHKFRHSIATHLLTSGANLRLIQDFLGHSSLSTVQIYTHLDLSDIKEEYKKFHLRS